MNDWQRTCRWEDRVGEQRANEIREIRRRKWTQNNPNSDPDMLKRKSDSIKTFLKTNPRLGEKNPFFGKHHTDSFKLNRSKCRKGKRFYNDEQFRRQNERTPRGENHPMWKGGISFEPYDYKWTKAFKNKIKKRDGNRCVECQAEGRLAIHHIDYDKINTEPNNCISLCFSCHGKTNIIDREKMTKYFQEKYKDKLNTPI